jgi:hypothetical protein
MLEGGFGAPEIPMFIEQSDSDSLRKVRSVKTLAHMARKLKESLPTPPFMGKTRSMHLPFATHAAHFL